jgi:ubiquinone/menaquinone biosynthesis C-methylase UbiE
MTTTGYDGSSDGWRRIDGQSDAAARYLEMMNRMLAEQKRQTMDLLRLKPGMSAIEIGCGLGLDAEALAARVGPTGRVVGIDASKDLIAEATKRTATLGLSLSFQVEDAQALSFPDNSFDGARVDRVLQHLSDPTRAVREMARVVRPGGRLAVLEPDWPSISVGGVDLDVTRAVVRYKSDVSLAHGAIGREVRRLLVEAGCRDVFVEQGSLTFGSLPIAERVLSLRRSLDGARDQGWITSAQAGTWWSGLETLDRDGKFYCALSGVMGAGTVQ